MKKQYLKSIVKGGLILLVLGLIGCVEPTAGGDSPAPKTLTATTFVFTGGGTDQDGAQVQNMKMEVTFRGRQELEEVEMGDGLNSYLTNLSFVVDGVETYFDYERRTDVFDLGIGGEVTEVSSDRLAFKANASQQTFKCWFDEDESEFEIDLTWPYTLTAKLKVETLPSCTFPNGEYVLQANLTETSDVWEEYEEEYEAENETEAPENQEDSSESQGGTDTGNPQSLTATTFVFAGEGENQEGDPVESLRMELTFRGRTALEFVEIGDGLNSNLTNLSFVANGVETYFDYERQSSVWDLGILGEATKVDEKRIVIEADASQQGLRCWFNNARFEIDLEDYTFSGVLDVRTLPGCTFPSGVYKLKGELVRTIDIWDEYIQ